jgi:hypothetical protein
MTGFPLYPKRFFAFGVKVHDRPIRYFFGEVCHDLSLGERAKRSIRHSAEQGCLSGTGLERTAKRSGNTIKNRF